MKKQIKPLDLPTYNTWDEIPKKEPQTLAQYLKYINSSEYETTDEEEKKPIPKKIKNKNI